MPKTGWQRLAAGTSWYRAAGRYPIPAYSEFMPPPRLGEKPYGAVEPSRLDSADPWGWPVSEYLPSLLARCTRARMAKTTSLTHGANTSQVEVGNIDQHGLWLLVDDREYFLPYDGFPWFRKARCRSNPVLGTPRRKPFASA
jgi:hypothetical protein